MRIRIVAAIFAVLGGFAQGAKACSPAEAQFNAQISAVNLENCSFQFRGTDLKVWNGSETCYLFDVDTIDQWIYQKVRSSTCPYSVGQTVTGILSRDASGRITIE